LTAWTTITNLVDFLNGSSFVMRPPPDALAEFSLPDQQLQRRIRTLRWRSYECQHQSGTQQIHGDVWEYLRNTSLDAKSWDATTIPPTIRTSSAGRSAFPSLAENAQAACL